jgi:hypothetical protein
MEIGMNYHPNRARPANPETTATVMHFASRYRSASEDAKQARKELALAVKVAKQSGHSYSQLTEATGLSVGVIQRMVK